MQQINMEKKDSETDWIERIYNKLTGPKTIKICGFINTIVFYGLLITAVLIAMVYSNYNIVDNWISDLGSFQYTPTPYLFDSLCIITGISIIPVIFYLEKHIAPIPRSVEELPARHRWIYRLSGPTFFLNIIASISLILVGIFSEDRDFGLHYPISYLTFGSFAFGAIFMGMNILVARENIIPKPFNFVLGFYGIFGPITIGVLTYINECPIMEWIVLFSLLVWLTPISIFTLRYALLDLKK